MIKLLSITTRLVNNESDVKTIANEFGACLAVMLWGRPDEFIEIGLVGTTNDGGTKACIGKSTFARAAMEVFLNKKLNKPHRLLESTAYREKGYDKAGRARTVMFMDLKGIMDIPAPQKQRLVQWAYNDHSGILCVEHVDLLKIIDKERQSDFTITINVPMSAEEFFYTRLTKKIGLKPMQLFGTTLTKWAATSHRILTRQEWYSDQPRTITVETTRPDFPMHFLRMNLQQKGFC
ncbi:MAG: hypothetical protein EB059_05255 [Alphaproteobacteria bacterium]|nr:hypothetical protein [Alphaproteobacteria bacterium]